MKLERFADTLNDIAATNSGNDKRDILVNVLHASETDDTEIFIRFLLGELYDDPERKTNVGKNRLYEAAADALGCSKADIESMADELGKAELGIEACYSQDGQASAIGGERTLHDIYTKIELLPEAGGDKERVKILKGLFTDCQSAKEAKWVAYCVIHDMSIGVGSGLVKKAVVRAFGTPRTRLDKAYAILGSMPKVIRLAKERGDLPEYPEPGTRFSPQLASSGDNMNFDENWWAQSKLDGARVLIHSRNGDIKVFTRNMKEVTHSLPEITEAFDTDRSFILDGEAVAMDDNGEPLPFQNIMKRFRRERRIEEMREEIPVKTFLFDAVNIDGQPLHSQPFDRRLASLEDFFMEVFDSAELKEWGECQGDIYFDTGTLSTVPSSVEVECMYEESLSRGHEGVIVKHKKSPYQFGERPSEWQKVKPSDTVDLYVSGYETGTGGYAGQLGALRLQTSDGHDVGKVGIGFSDEFRVSTNEEDIVGKVIEVEAEELQSKSDKLGLRFPRFVSIRDTKDEADDLDRVRKVLNG